MVLVMGSASTARTAENPLTAEERRDIIHQCFPDLEIVAMEDEGPTEEDNKRWAEKLDAVTAADTAISQNPLVKRLVREYTGMEVEEQELYNPEELSGTEVRRRIRQVEDWRALVPECAQAKVEEYLEIIRETGEG